MVGGKGLNDPILCVPLSPPKMQGRDTMAETIRCADGLEKVTPFKSSNFLVSMLDFWGVHKFSKWKQPGNPKKKASE